MQHDHYVPAVGRPNAFKIYRGDRPDGGQVWDPGESPFPFGPEHAWLAQAVAVRFFEEGPVVRGTVSDGDLTSPDGESLALYDDEGIVFHEPCWRALGEPRVSDDTPKGVGSYPWSFVAPYHLQLFAFQDFVEDGKGWMLADPSGTTKDAERSRLRIEALAQEARRLHGLQQEELPATVAEALVNAHGWTARRFRDPRGQRRFHRFREDLSELETASHPERICLIQAYSPALHNQPGPTLRAALESFELQAKAAAEADEAAILVASTIGGQDALARLYLYARDEAETRTRLAALPGVDLRRPFEFDAASDPDWDTFFEEVIPCR